MDIIGAPTWLGCDRKGPEISPVHLRERGLVRQMERSGTEVCDLGNIPLIEPGKEEKFADGSNMKYIDQVLDFDRRLAEKVYESVSVGAVPLVIGGDHSIALGSISGSASFHPELGVIWIDAHGDINTDETSPSGNIHGMCLAALMGFGDKRLTELYTDKIKIDPKNVFLVGVRSLDEGEKELIEREGIKVFYMEDIRRNGIGATVEELMLCLQKRNISKIHCSLDIDVLDPEYAPGTGTKVENGMKPDELFYTLDRLSTEMRLVSCDLVELNPLLDDKEESTSGLALELAEFISNMI